MYLKVLNLKLYYIINHFYWNLLDDILNKLNYFLPET